MRDRLCRGAWALAAWAAASSWPGMMPPRAAEAAPPGIGREDVEKAIKEGVEFLLREQRPDGSWAPSPARRPSSPWPCSPPASQPTPTRSAAGLAVFRNVEIAPAHATYSIALITMAMAAADPEKYRDQIAKNAIWLEQAQTRTGAWSYNSRGGGAGDNSNTQYALLGLHAASEAGFAVQEDVWLRSRRYWETTQNGDGGWSYHPGGGAATGSMTCAGISSLIITGLKHVQGRESLVGGRIEGCGEHGVNPHLQRGIDWLSTHFDARQNPGMGQAWLYYYLYGVERAGRLSGRRYFGQNDWYREGAAYDGPVDQDRLQGFVAGAVGERDGPGHWPPASRCCSSPRGGAPVLINKFRHGPGAGLEQRPRRRRRTSSASSRRDWKHLLTWQIDRRQHRLDRRGHAPGPDRLLQRPHGPRLLRRGAGRLREYVEQGGLIVAEACCGRQAFDVGFRDLMKAIFPERELDLNPLPADHAIWRSKYRLRDPATHPLWGIEHGCRTVVIYSPDDLSCYWNQLENSPGNPRVRSATALGQNIVDYATGRELPADKLDVRDVADFKDDHPRRGALRIAKLRHAGDWNIAPLAIPNLTTALRDRLKFDVVINHKELFARDPGLVHYPLIYLHGRAAVDFSEDDRVALRRHLTPGGGTLFADAACGSPAFDAAFRRFVADLLPSNPLVPIPKDDDLYTRKVGYDLADARLTPAAGGKADFPELEGVKIDGRWAVIYSKLDLGCALQKQAGIECRGYVHESALRIATNIVLYATLP